MRLSARGNSTSAVEVTNISVQGVWLLAHDREFFMPYKTFPWFKEQRVSAIVNVEEPSPGHFYWPELDVDLTQDMIEHPGRFPGVANNK
jgi:hypothetical protein